MSRAFVSAAALEASDLAEFNGCQAMLKELVRSRLCSSFASASVRAPCQHTGLTLVCQAVFKETQAVVQPCLCSPSPDIRSCHPNRTE